MANILRLTESQLRDIIQETINHLLTEMDVPSGMVDMFGQPIGKKCVANEKKKARKMVKRASDLLNAAQQKEEREEQKRLAREKHFDEILKKQGYKRYDLFEPNLRQV